MIQHFARIQHRFGKRRKLGAVYPADPHRHQPRGHLVIRYFPARIAGNEVFDLFPGEFPGVTFFADQVDGAHACAK